MAHSEKMTQTQPLFKGKNHCGKKGTRSFWKTERNHQRVVVHHGGVCIAAIDEKDNILLVKQFRYPYGQELIELPAGKIELGEDPKTCGIRELEEECGCTADHFEKLTELYPTPAYCTEIIHIYYAQGLHETKQHLDEGEFLTVMRVPFSQAVQMVLSGEIKDAKTQIGILNLLARRTQKTTTM